MGMLCTALVGVPRLLEVLSAYLPLVVELVVANPVMAIFGGLLACFVTYRIVTAVWTALLNRIDAMIPRAMKVPFIWLGLCKVENADEGLTHVQESVGDMRDVMAELQGQVKGVQTKLDTVCSDLKIIKDWVEQQGSKNPSALSEKELTDNSPTRGNLRQRKLK